MRADDLNQSDRNTISRIRRGSKQIYQKYNARDMGFEAKYTLGKKIGEGMHSVVFECFTKDLLERHG